MMKVLLIAPNVDATDVGEAFVAYKWAHALSGLVDLTVLAFQRHGRPDLAGQLPGARVVTWLEPQWARKNKRLNAMLKPAWPIFARHVQRWMDQAFAQGEHLDIAHQLMPQAARYASPLRHFDVPYLIGPLGGALETPAAFQAETASAPLFTRLRALDRVRFKHDPFLRNTYAKAACILGVAPYMRKILSDVPLRRFEVVLELGIDDVVPPCPQRTATDRLRVLHVGRGVRTKGLRDTVRALATLKDLPGVTLTSAGDGEDIEICRAEAVRLGVADRVTFHGRLPRSEVEALYASHDVFCFPSFREPAGGVLYEAMRHGLPVITADRGGPGWIIRDASGLRIPVTDPAKFAQDIGQAIRLLTRNPQLRNHLGAGARQQVLNEGLWSAKATSLVDLYRSIVGQPFAASTLRLGSPTATPESFGSPFTQ